MYILFFSISSSSALQTLTIITRTLSLVSGQVLRQTAFNYIIIIITFLAIKMLARVSNTQSTDDEFASDISL